MRRLTAVLGSVMVTAGMLVALYPVISVWNLSGEVLEHLPAADALTYQDDRNRLAISDPAFILATRSYEGVSVDQLEAALIDDGFERTAMGGERWFIKTCCGSFDAVQVRIDGVGDGSTLATVTLVDGDVQLAWPVIAFFGLVVVIGGVAAVIAGRRRPPGFSAGDPPPHVEPSSGSRADLTAIG